MKTYKDKLELIKAINSSFDRFFAEFADVDESEFNARVESVDKTPFEMIAYQIGWLKLLLSWESDEKSGKEVITPKAGIKWNELGKLYKEFYDEYRTLSKWQILELFTSSKDEFVAWVSLLSEDEIFKQNQRKWANNAAKWQIYKWIHINSVAPFTNFRTKIRKFKKLRG
ncbi:ClbS/DfsB family four-helix bundle protein [Campylobacter geochelonis]|uniref:Uncharacterized conserved protein n=1 Tax=Campylobacter geochelonis TaxID=1780362 RepID=A0A128EPC3_9BACT|nr:ClbS/DfsB family four-helix bundle protein [Campylobacter geochelonis]QKF70755.1 ClbS/DfsB family four-helix bundle protein [Campylobacter geochelonis]CZE47297.1 Uncharacterized conserved protein [Campylobacter geochelonis]CZE48603.1 Uncharacterized conserved protein [Campylobacter geochelonis]CZE50524.1 Uncharacterized conserved protein [Campylobacter geochelonis]